ncbi:MAG: peptidoglycan DD-metalloendopeptidase family protein [Gammaproteobacteria bacterium]|jgi:murein DD-endopeptidase MepM/ murein hydrolase activator NlpD|nr:peptidoglycan DD-metalloendopeptidase family protein [Gammaproteobacteria bacterium]
MRIILLKESGRAQGSVREVQLRPFHLAGVFLLLSALVLALSFYFVSLSSAANNEAMIAEWQARIAEQQEIVDTLRDRSAAESQAVGRQLAAMQARLLRMEALGTRVTEVAELEEGEFSFDTPAPVGGPAAAEQKALAWSELQSNLEGLSVQLRARESELEVLESLLRNREFHQGTEVAGRPVTWGWMSSAYGNRVDPFSGQKAWHAGVDFAGREGSDVVAVASGVVTYADERYGYGKMVEINHGDGYVTRYGHHASLAVTIGEIVKKGQVIGTMGSSGRSTGPHVHFEVLKNGRHVDPKRYVARR